MTNTLLPLTSAELSDLKAKAKVATPGEWKKDETHADVFVVYVDDVTHENAATVLFEADWATDTDAEFVAAANPETILRLIAMIERLRDDLMLTLPMAKGYAHGHRVGPNSEIVRDAEAHLEALATTEPTR